MFQRDGLTYPCRLEWMIENQIDNLATKKRHKRHSKNKRSNHRRKIEVWHMKEFTMDVPLSGRCALRLTKSSEFHTNNGKPNNYDWKHSKIEIVLDDKPIVGPSPNEKFERGDNLPVEFDIGNQHFIKYLVNLKGSVFMVADSKEAKRVIREVQNKHM